MDELLKMIFETVRHVRFGWDAQIGSVRSGCTDRFGLIGTHRSVGSIAVHVGRDTRVARLDRDAHVLTVGVCTTDMTK